MFFSLMNIYTTNVYNTVLTEALKIMLPVLWKVETCNIIHFQYWTGKKSLESPQECENVPFYEVYTMHLESGKC